MSTTETELPRSNSLAAAIMLAIGVAVVAGIALAITVMTSDPTPDKERVFVALVVCLVTALSAGTILIVGGRTGSPLKDALRAYRRGILAGLACAGIIVLELNAALTPANLAFLFLVLLIVEMVFLARRQDVAS